MTRPQVQQIQTQMHHLTDKAQRTTIERERAQFQLEQRRLWLSIKPYVTGALPYSDMVRA